MLNFRTQEIEYSCLGRGNLSKSLFFVYIYIYENQRFLASIAIWQKFYLLICVYIYIGFGVVFWHNLVTCDVFKLKLTAMHKLSNTSQWWKWLKKNRIEVIWMLFCTLEGEIVHYMFKSRWLCVDLHLFVQSNCIQNKKPCEYTCRFRIYNTRCIYNIQLHVLACLGKRHSNGIWYTTVSETLHHHNLHAETQIRIRSLWW